MKAYLEPVIDESKERFSWSVPNLVGVRDFARERFGWDTSQIDQILKPVVRAMAAKLDNGSQVRIDQYFSSWRVALPEKGRLVASKRVDEAIRKFRGFKSPVKGSQSPAKNSQSPVKNSQSPVKNIRGPLKKKAVNRTAKQMKVTKVEDKQEAEKANGPTNSSELSLVAQSCGFVLNPSKDDIAKEKILQKEERERRAQEAKEKAIEIFNKSKKSKQNQVKKKFKRPKRVVTTSHDLSGSESD